MVFADPANHKIIHKENVKIKENEKGGDRYLDLAKELKKLWNIKMMVMPIVISGLKRSSKHGAELEE